MPRSYTFVSSPIHLPSLSEIINAGRAVIDVSGIDQAGPSFEGRIFVNNPDAGSETPMTEEEGYAGSFHVYGYGMPTSSGTPARATGSTATRRTAELPMRRTVEATPAIFRATSAAPSATITIVPVLPGAPSSRDAAVEKALTDLLTVDDVAVRVESKGKGGDPR